MLTIDKDFIKGIAKIRDEESHKGDYGHLLIVGGCQAMPGAALLATNAALRSGCGLVSLHSTSRTLTAAAISMPSAMLSEDSGNVFSEIPWNINQYSAIVAGPGLGKNEQTVKALEGLMTEARNAGIPMLLDADALNIISEHREMLGLIPAGSVLTPHAGELRRLIRYNDEAEKEREIAGLCKMTGCTVVAKLHRTVIYSPGTAEGETVKAVNTTGNAGMAKGGSGDVLAGLVGGLMARGYDAFGAAAMGVWIHGYAGDCLTAEYTAESYSSKDLAENLFRGFLVISRQD